MNHMINVLMVDRQIALRQGLQLLFAKTPDIRLTDDAGSTSEAIGLLRKNAYDALLIDINLLGKQTFHECLEKLKAEFPALSIIIFSAETSPPVVRKALAAGVSGYIGKCSPPIQLIEAIRKASGGERMLDPTIAQSIALDSLKSPERQPHEQLSGREQEIFSLLAQGKSINEIGTLLYRSPKTVSTHKARLMRKMGLNTDLELIRYALTHQLA